MLSVADVLTIEVGPGAVARVAPQTFPAPGGPVSFGAIHLELETGAGGIQFNLDGRAAAILGVAILRAQLGGESWQYFLAHYPDSRVKAGTE